MDAQPFPTQVKISVLPSGEMEINLLAKDMLKV
jgi:hypothetical protein